MSDQRVHIAGMLVQTRLEAQESVIESLKRRAGVDVRASGYSGKFVVVVECGSERELGDFIAELQALSGVLLVSMTSHYIEDAACLAAEMPT